MAISPYEWAMFVSFGIPPNDWLPRRRQPKQSVVKGIAYKLYTNREDLRVSLFANDYHPNKHSEAYNFEPASFRGYRDRLLTYQDWQRESDYMRGSCCSYEAESDQMIYGYYITEEYTGFLVWAERFGMPRFLESGVCLSLMPVIQGAA